jgi:hypothetical protein
MCPGRRCSTPIDTTELDWRQQARKDGWTLLDGHWQHPDYDLVYDDTEWVYLGNGNWEDADVLTWTRALPRSRSPTFE